MASIRNRENLPPSTRNATPLPSVEKKRILDRIKVHFATKRQESEERNRIKENQKLLEVAKNKKQVEKVDEIMDRIRQEQILLHKLKSNELSADQLAKLENTIQEDKQVLPKGVAEKREDAMKEFNERKRFGDREVRNPGDKQLFPSGFQSRRKITIVDPETGKKTTEFTSKLSNRDIKNIQLTDVVDGEPVFEDKNKHMENLNPTEKQEKIKEFLEKEELKENNDTSKGNDTSQTSLFVGSQGDRT